MELIDIDPYRGLGTRIQREYPMIHVLIGCQSRTSARISELLNITWADRISKYEFRVKGLKGSRSYLLMVPDIEILERFKSGSTSKIFGTYSVSSVNRIYSKYGLFSVSSKRKSRIVTHSFRHERVARLRFHGFSKEDIRDIMHHNSVKSQEYYGK